MQEVPSIIWAIQLQQVHLAQHFQDLFIMEIQMWPLLNITQQETH